MKLILIVLLVLCGLGFCSFRVYHYFADKSDAAKVKQVQAAEWKESAKHPPKVDGPATAPVLGDLAPISGHAPVSEVSVGAYRFERRLVPDAPAFLRDETKAAMMVQTDSASNSWVWIGSPVLGSQILDLAKSYDLQQVEMDLDFVLVLLNTEKLRSYGLSVFYSESATWLSALSLQGDTGSLRLSSGGFALDLDYSNDKTGLSVLSQPVIRCLDGQPWKFATDSEIPVPKSEVVDGVVRRSVEFRKVGFGLDGVVRVVGKSVLLKVDQRNGSVAPATSKETEFPVFNVQSLSTSCELAFSEWSVLGGIAVEREESRRGFFRDSMKSTSDYLVIFVRPRLALEAPPRAVPVAGSGSDAHPLLSDGVLPSKGWLDREIKRVESNLEHSRPAAVSK